MLIDVDESFFFYCNCTIEKTVKQLEKYVHINNKSFWFFIGTLKIAIIAGNYS